MNRITVGIALGACLALLGCSNKDASKSNFKAAIQNYLDTTPALCASLPADDGKTSFQLDRQQEFLRSRIEQAEALAEAGLLTARNVELPAGLGGKPRVATEFDLSDEGRKFLVKTDGLARSTTLCTGKYTVSEVVNFTEPSEMMGAKISRVNYRYKVEDAADWTRHPGVAKAFPEWQAKAAPDGASEAAVVVATNDGWMHERLFRKGQ
jgi:hypothetical protein